MAGVVAVALVAAAMVDSWCLLGALQWALAAWMAWTAAAVVGVLEVRLAVVSVEWPAEVRLGVPFFLLPFLRASHQGAGHQIRSDRRKLKPFANPDTNQPVAVVCVDRFTIPLSLSLRT